LAEGKVIRAVLTLTSSESKRLIGKAVAKMDVVNRALKQGSIIIGVGTTNSFVAEEITGRKIDRNHFSAGIITPQGLGITSPSKRLYPLLVRRGEISLVKPSDLRKICDELSSKDVIIKGANALDFQRNAGVITLDPSGGTMGAIWNAINNRGVKLVVPVGLEKMIPGLIPDVKKKLEEGKVKIWKQMGVPPNKVYLLPGEVVTEIEAFRILSNVEATPMAAGGIGGAEGSITLLIEGNEESVKKAWEIASQVKGEPPIKGDPQG